MSPTKHMYRVN